jgi:hypothetical protein
MRTVIGRSLAACAGVAMALTFPGLISAQVPTRSSEPRLVVPTTAAPVPSQPTVAPAPVAPAAAQPETTVTAVTAAPGAVTTVPVQTQTTSSTTQAATIDTRSYTAARFYLELGLASGTAGTYVHRVEGGDPIADVVKDEKLGGGGLIPQHVANVKRTDIIAEVRPNEFTDLIREFLQEKYTAVDGRLVGLDLTLKPTSQVGFSRAMLTGVDLPALDVSSLDPAYLTIHLTPEAAQDQQPGSAPAGATTGAKQSLVRSFSLTIPGLETKRVTRIEPLSISTKLTPDQIGVVRVATTQPGKLGWGYLTVTFSAADAASWMAWRDDFLIKGNNTNEAEKSLVLTLLSSDLTTRLLELNGSGVGLVTLRRLPAATSTDAAAKYQAQLYVEQWSVGKGTSKGS